MGAHTHTHTHVRTIKIFLKVKKSLDHGSAAFGASAGGKGRRISGGLRLAWKSVQCHSPPRGTFSLQKAGGIYSKEELARLFNMISLQGGARDRIYTDRTGSL